MYKIYADGETIHNPAMNDDTRLVVDAKISQKVNMADALEFTIYPNNAGAASIHKLTTTIEVYQDDLLLFRGRPIQSKTGWENQVTYTCEGGLAVLNDTIVRPYSFTGSVRDYLQQLITHHNNQVPAAKQITLRTVTVTDPNNTIVRSNSDYVTTMQEIQDKLVENLGGYLVLSYDAQTGWILDYLAASPRATGQAITLAKNLLDMLREQNAENIATALIPLGAVDKETGERITIRTVNSGQDYIVDQTAAARYGLIFTTETWDDVTIPANLLRKAQARLTDYATMIPTIKLTAVDLSAIDPDLDPIRILDEVTVQDDKHEASGVYLVAERTYDLSAPERDTVTFGGNLPSITKASAKTAAAVQDIPAQVLQTASDRTRAILDAATDGAIQILYNENGVAYELRINNSQNPETATKWWRYNSGGWGYTADGGQTYTIAATMDGAFLANVISSGILQSREGNNPKFYLNLDTGELRGNFSSLSIQSDSVATQGYTNAAAASAQSAAETTAAADATAKANAAQSAAEATAAADATSKANAAQTAAINAAATDATAKANAAQSAAEATAAADATAKANAAEAAAVSTAASNTSAAISSYDSNLNQQAVFNKLTNNQANQGIYIEDGQVYINASMIAAGTIRGVFIDLENEDNAESLARTKIRGKHIFWPGTANEFTEYYETMLSPTGVVAGHGSGYDNLTSKGSLSGSGLNFTVNGTDVAGYGNSKMTLKNPSIRAIGYSGSVFSSEGSSKGSIWLGQYSVAGSYYNPSIAFHIGGRATNIWCYVTFSSGSSYSDASISTFYAVGTGPDTPIYATRSTGSVNGIDCVQFSFYIDVNSTYYQAQVDDVIIPAYGGRTYNGGIDNSFFGNGVYLPNSQVSQAHKKASKVYGSSNASSGYYRLPWSGTQIAWKQVSWTGAINQAWGSSVYESQSVISLGDWAKSFSSTPSVTYSAHTSGTNTAWVAAGNIPPSASSAGSVFLERGGSTLASNTWTIRAMAIGPYNP